MELKKIFRIKSTVALVYEDGKLDVFLSNTREQFVIEINYEKIVELLFCFDGSECFDSIAMKFYDINKEELYALLVFLNDRRTLIDVDAKYDWRILEKNYRLISLLEDYHTSTSGVINALQLLSSGSVMVIGMGAVGTWIVDSLARTGVRHFTIVDDDNVELSNLHRQDLFFEADVGKSKVDVVHEKLIAINRNIKVTKIKAKLNHDFFSKYSVDFDIVVNCADYPSVDATTNIIGKESMRRNLPHIIGGGYNLHLTLIGQTVIPHITACVKCFEKHLESINNADLEGVKKLVRRERKIGSFSPLCSLSASLAATDILKVLIKKNEFINNSNNRIEFTIKDRDFNQHQVEKNPDCPWCGNNGVFKLK